MNQLLRFAIQLELSRPEIERQYGPDMAQQIIVAYVQKFREERK